MRKNIFKSIIDEGPVLFKSLLDKETPVGAKILAILVILYLINPFDIIPDPVLFAGLIDDGVMLAAGLWIIYRIIPPEITDKYRKQIK